MKICYIKKSVIDNETAGQRGEKREDERRSVQQK
jgi:hypothetical protein